MIGTAQWSHFRGVTLQSEMSIRPERELKIDLPLAILLTLLPFAYENFDLPHSKTVGYVTLAACVGLVFRVIWIVYIVFSRMTTITFKDASAFTWPRREIIKYDVAGLDDYFAALGIPVPKIIPPLTVFREGQSIFNPPHIYRGYLNIPLREITDRKAVTHVYAVYVMQCAFPDPSKSPQFWSAIPESFLRVSQTTFFSADLREYFHASYWNSINTQTGLPAGALVLWKIREVCGRDFADRLASQVFRVAADSLSEIGDPDFHTMFAKALRIADGVIEAYGQRWPKIQKILDENPIKAEFRFDLGGSPTPPL